MAVAILDMPRILKEFEISYTNSPGSLCAMLREGQESVNNLAARGLYDGSGNFGWAISRNVSLRHNVHRNWNDPFKFTQLVGGWGNNREVSIARAMCKMRAALREKTSTLELRCIRPDAFQDIVDPMPGKPLLWGDYPWGGCARVKMGEFDFYVAVSGLSEREDHTEALRIGGWCIDESLNNDPRFAE